MSGRHRAKAAGVRAVEEAAEEAATYGTSNVFADLGFESPEEELLKADLALTIGQRIGNLGLSQAKAGERMGVSQPDVSKIVRGRTEGYSLERLLGFLNRLGSDVDITVSTPATETGEPGQTRLRRVEAV